MSEQIELTDKQREALLSVDRIGDYPITMKEREIVHQLVELGLVYYKGSDWLAFTDEGENLYNELERSE